MYFQTFEMNKECKHFYAGDRYHEVMAEEFQRTWKCGEQGDRFEYASLYVGGATLTEVCPPSLDLRWETASGKIKAYIKASAAAQIPTEEICVFKVLPLADLTEFLEVKNLITQHIFDHYPKPANYDFLVQLGGWVQKIKKQRLNIELEAMNSHLHEYKGREFCKLVQRTHPYIDFDMFGTRTGRLSTRRGSFPLLTMAKDYRKIIKPTNDCFVELDYNAAELRVLLALAGKEQPADDLHEWNAKHVYRGLQDRGEAKKRIFAWLYNPQSKEYLSEKAYHKESVKEKYFSGSKVRNPFGREIECDEYHALNYLIQSTASDVFLRQALKVDKQLEVSPSFIAFALHDSLIIDFNLEDRESLEKLQQTFAETSLGNFKTSMKIGKDFGNMKAVE